MAKFFQLGGQFVIQNDFPHLSRSKSYVLFQDFFSFKFDLFLRLFHLPIFTLFKERSSFVVREEKRPTVFMTLLQLRMRVE